MDIFGNESPASKEIVVTTLDNELSSEQSTTLSKETLTSSNPTTIHTLFVFIAIPTFLIVKQKYKK